MTLPMYPEGLVHFRVHLAAHGWGPRRRSESAGAQARALAAVLFRYVPESKRHRTPLTHTRGVGRHSGVTCDPWHL